MQLRLQYASIWWQPTHTSIFENCLLSTHGSSSNQTRFAICSYKGISIEIQMISWQHHEHMLHEGDLRFPVSNQNLQCIHSVMHHKTIYAKLPQLNARNIARPLDQRTRTSSSISSNVHGISMPMDCPVLAIGGPPYCV